MFEWFAEPSASVSVEAEIAQTQVLERRLKKFSFRFAVELRGGVGCVGDGEEENLVCGMALGLEQE